MTMALDQYDRRYHLLKPLMVSILVMGLGLVVSGCRGGDPDIDITSLVDNTEPPDVLYNQALANLEAGNLTEANRKFQAIDKQHPYSEYARRALVMSAFVQYRQGNYTDAVSAANRFIGLYPSDEDAAYAQYIVGLSYFRQIPDVTREQRSSARAIAAMNELVQRYPDSEYVTDAREKIRIARDQLAGKEMQIGRYYQERKEYIAAVNRYRIVVERYGNTRQVEEALARLVESYLGMGLQSEAQTAAAVLGHNFPDSDWYRDSYAMLNRDGLEPEENTGSWISRAGSVLMGDG